MLLLSATDIAYVLHSGGTFSREDVLGSLDAVFGLFKLMDNVPSDRRLAAMTPTEFLRAYQPGDVEYDLVDF